MIYIGMVVNWSNNTVDSPNTRIFFSLLLCSIFPPPRHLHSIPKGSRAGLTFSKIWSENEGHYLLLLLFPNTSNLKFKADSRPVWCLYADLLFLWCLCCLSVCSQTAAPHLLWYSAFFVPRTTSLCISPSFTLTLTRMYLKVPSGSISTSGTLARHSAIMTTARAWRRRQQQQ